MYHHSRIDQKFTTQKMYTHIWFIRPFDTTTQWNEFYRVQCDVSSGTHCTLFVSEHTQNTRKYAVLLHIHIQQSNTYLLSYHLLNRHCVSIQYKDPITGQLKKQGTFFSKEQRYSHLDGRLSNCKTFMKITILMFKKSN